MEVSTSAFYAWIKTPEDTDKKILKKQLETKAVQLFEENKKIYGSRRLSEAFIKEDFQVGRYKAKQLMKKLGLKPRYPKRFKVTTDSNHNDAISPNLLNRKFDVTVPNKVWTTDIIPIPINSYTIKAHFLEQRFRMVSGWLAKVFHAWQHTSTISS